MFNFKRTVLPSKRVDRPINVWSIIKGNLGKDISKISVPGKMLFYLFLKFTLTNLYPFFKEYAKTFNMQNY